ncbi:MAG: RNA polymerase sigma-D factor [Chlamydiae bacterium]|nr:RNA polymerase sigma-D factor [Chlamydiota bacterium]
MEKQEAKSLWDQYRKQATIEDRDALIVHYLPLVKLVVGRLGSSYPAHVKLDDLYSSGVTGLIRAVEKYDESKNVKFESYSILLIKGAIIDELRELDWIPRGIHQKVGQIEEALHLLHQKLRREPTDSELSLHLGISERELGELLERVRPAIFLPLDVPASYSTEDETVSLAERIADTKVETSSEAAQKREYASILASVIGSLPEQEKQVISLYYYEELMLKEIGKILGVSESRISQIHTKALLKLRKRLRDLAK